MYGEDLIIMMNKKNKFYTSGLFVLGAVFIAVCLIYVIKLVNMQITGVDKYISTNSKTYTRYETVQAVRGEIYDRNGKPLITNEYTNTVQLSYNSLKNYTSSGKNNVISQLSFVLEDYGGEFATHFPIVGTYPHVSYDNEALGNNITKKRFESFLKKNKLDEDISCVDLFEWLLEYYDVKNPNGTHVYEGRTQYDVIAVRYELDTMNFAPDNPFVIKEEAPLRLVTAILERASTGIYVEKEWKRVYNYPGLASHILGRVGKIPANEIDKYLEKGYKYDAVVGLDGAEKAFETLLKGTEGQVKITEDEYGGIISTENVVESVPGRNVYLTIDIDLQRTAEEELAKNIHQISSNAKDDLSGKLADSGAISAVDPNTGQVLALASYPSFDLATFTENYAILANDEKRPLFNRALFGNYAPGSTFKMAVSAAALTCGEITGGSKIECTGEYEFYKDYQPDCWYKAGHGDVNLRNALGVSCNCYYYDVGRRLGIEAMNEYCTTLGLGQYTGIELSESNGVLAGPVYYSEKNLGVWMPGDTLQAAIGQGGNAVTPLQLSIYVSTIINSGTRYKATVLYKSETFSGADVKYNEPEVLGQAELSDEHATLIKQGMKQSQEGTSTLRKYKFPIGSKTGTAQISKQNNNAVFTAFAPYNDPEIVVSCVIENGAAGRNAATSVAGVISYRFGLDENGEKLPEETEAPETDAEETKKPHTPKPPVAQESKPTEDTVATAPSETREPIDGTQAPPDDTDGDPVEDTDEPPTDGDEDDLDSA